MLERALGLAQREPHEVLVAGEEDRRHSAATCLDPRRLGRRARGCGRTPGTARRCGERGRDGRPAEHASISSRYQSMQMCATSLRTRSSVHSYTRAAHRSQCRFACLPPPVWPAALAVPAGAAAAGYVPGEVIVRYEDRIGPRAAPRSSARSRHPTWSKRSPAARGGCAIDGRRDGAPRRWPSCGATRACASRSRTGWSAPRHSRRTTPPSARQWNLSSRFGVGTRRRHGSRAPRAAPPAAAGPSVAVLDIGRGLRAPRGASAGRPTCAPRLRRAATTSSTTTATRTTRTATAPTWPARSPRRTNNRTASPAWPTARGSCRCGCSTRAASATRSSIARALRLRRAKGRRRDQHLGRVRGARARRGQDPGDRLRQPLRSRRGMAIVSASGNWATRRSNYPAAAPGVIAVGATTVRGCQADYSNAGAGLDMVAPGGGGDAAPRDNQRDAATCRPGVPGRRSSSRPSPASARSARSGFPTRLRGDVVRRPARGATAALAHRQPARGPKPEPRRWSSDSAQGHGTRPLGARRASTRLTLRLHGLARRGRGARARAAR